jgi:oligopeptidase A
MTVPVSNPLLDYSGLPPFEHISSEQVVPAVRSVLATIRSSFTHLERTYQPSWEGLMRPLEKYNLLLHKVWSPISHLNSVKNSPELRNAYEQVQAEVVALSLQMNQSSAIYQGLGQLKASAAWKKLSPGQQRAVECAMPNSPAIA